MSVWTDCLEQPISFSRPKINPQSGASSTPHRSPKATIGDRQRPHTTQTHLSRAQRLTHVALVCIVLPHSVRTMAGPHSTPRMNTKGVATHAPEPQAQLAMHFFARRSRKQQFFGPTTLSLTTAHVQQARAKGVMVGRQISTRIKVQDGVEDAEMEVGSRRR